MIPVVPLPFQHKLNYFLFRQTFEKIFNICAKIFNKIKISAVGFEPPTYKDIAFNLKWSRPVLGGSHFFWEPDDSDSLMILWEPDRFSNKFFLTGENQSGYQIFIFSNSPGSQISRSSYTLQQPVFTSGSHNLIIKFFIN